MHDGLVGLVYGLSFKISSKSHMNAIVSLLKCADPICIKTKSVDVRKLLIYTAHIAANICKLKSFP